MAVMASASLWAVEDDINEYVNNNANFMGIASQSRWCDHNVGTKVAAEYGSYYQWGNIHTQGSYNAASYGNMYTEIHHRHSRMVCQSSMLGRGDVLRRNLA